MSYFNQFYTGAEQAYFPAPAEGSDPGRQRKRRLLAGTVVAVSVAAFLMIAGIYWLWEDTPAEKLTVVQVPVRKQMYPGAYPAVFPAASTHREPFAPPDSERRTKITKPAGEATETTQPQFPVNPQLRRILLDNPAVLPPFPTERNLSVGTPRAHLVRAFGRPNLSARTLQHERLVETYVYEQQDQATFIKMQDGKVVSTYTGQPQQGRVLSSEPGPDF
jgi:hypothetical protein